MTHRVQFQTTIVALCITFGLIGCQRSSYDLAIKLPPNTSYALIMTSHENSSITLPGGEIKIDGAIETHYELKPIEGDSTSGYTFEGTIRTGKLEEFASIGGATTIPFQNASGNSPLQELLRSMEGKSFQFTLSPKGEVGPITGADSLHEAIEQTDFSNIPLLQRMPAKAREVLIDSWRSAFSDDSLQASLQFVFHILPDKRVRKGDSWTIAAYADPEIGAMVSRTLMLTKIENNRLILSDTQTMEAAPGGDTPLVASGTGQGTITLEPATGLPLRQEWKMTLTSTAPVATNGTLDATTEMFPL